MAKWRAKPTTVDAIQWLGHNWNEVCDFMPIPGAAIGHLGEGNKMQIKLYTNDIVMTADIGDFIVKDEDDHFYFCKPEVFYKRYEKVKN